MSQARNLVDYGTIVGTLTGEIKMWGVPTPPTGFLLCDGSAVSRVTYAKLFAVYNSAFGNGDGTTTFNLPNYMDKMPIGAGNLYNLAAAGGSKDAIAVSHSHTVTDPGHSHGVTDPGHAHSIGYTGNLGYSGGGGNASTFWGAGSNQGTNSAGTGISLQGASTGLTVASAGASGTNANLPPYLGIYFIVRYL